MGRRPIYSGSNDEECRAIFFFFLLPKTTTSMYIYQRGTGINSFIYFDCESRRHALLGTKKTNKTRFVRVESV